MSSKCKRKDSTDIRMWRGLSWLRLVSNYVVHFFCDRLYITPNFTKDITIFDQLRNHQLLKKCCINTCCNFNINRNNCVCMLHCRKGFRRLTYRPHVITQLSTVFLFFTISGFQISFFYGSKLTSENMMYLQNFL